MAYVVTENCIKFEYMDCIEVCSVECFYEGETMLVINPEHCTDCVVCEPGCPEQAIRPDIEPDPDRWLEISRNYSHIWPNVTRKREQSKDTAKFRGLSNKLERGFSRLSGNQR
jgi:ferredoxin